MTLTAWEASAAWAQAVVGVALPLFVWWRSSERDKKSAKKMQRLAVHLLHMEVMHIYGYFTWLSWAKESRDFSNLDSLSDPKKHWVASLDRDFVRGKFDLLQYLEPEYVYLFEHAVNQAIAARVRIQNLVVLGEAEQRKEMNGEYINSELDMHIDSGSRAAERLLKIFKTEYDVTMEAIQDGE